ncbi:serine hydrolase [Lysobacter sp. SG-8]|uniref:Serine hydrolase n=1 Tax=Marilutibacter penaei TaxID=2759900 RepID=A0A7W3U0W0_9GAMM|nr:serine hydrolase [Lysobacter penaei]MBB1086886.1 serine hydrolase [Lysobacter penaei]
MPVAPRTLPAAVLVIGLLAATPVLAAPPTDLDTRVEEAMSRFGVPGMAVAIVEEGRPVFAKGYGVRELGGDAAVDADTLFLIGSTSKAFTAAALAVLVDDGKLGWDDRVIDHMPGFQMHDPWVTREITVRDLLVHRSGLGLGAGDLMFVPRTSRSREELVEALRHIKPATSFRSGYAYDNVLYVVAGQLVEEVSGQRWEEFVRDRLLRPAGMARSTTLDTDLYATPNRVQPHARLDGPIRGTGNQQTLDERAGLPQVTAPAGLIASSANDMAQWLSLQLGHGALPDGTRVFSEAQAREMWTPVVPIPVSPLPEPIAATTPLFSSYSLGWNVRDYRGVRVIEHSGAVFGVQAVVVLVPERDIGFSLHINSEDGAVLRGLQYELLDHYLDAPDTDWIKAFGDFRQARVDGALQALQATAPEAKQSRPSLPLADYAGRFRDPWYGPMEIRQERDGLRIDFQNTPDMEGTLSHWQYDTFRADWDDKTLEPAYVTFALDAEGHVERVTMKAVSPIADFSFDFHDLLFTPVRGEE